MEQSLLEQRGQLARELMEAHERIVVIKHQLITGEAKHSELRKAEMRAEACEHALMKFDELNAAALRDVNVASPALLHLAGHFCGVTRIPSR